MYNLSIIKQNGNAYIDSREVAEAIGKRHHHLLRDISGYIKIMRKSTETNFGFSDFFVESSYFDGTGRELPRYLLSKLGCEICAHKLTARKAFCSRLLMSGASIKWKPPNGKRQSNPTRNRGWASSTQP
jgi:Rha family phage regulatory protein